MLSKNLVRVTKRYPTNSYRAIRDLKNFKSQTFKVLGIRWTKATTIYDSTYRKNYENTIVSTTSE